MKDEIFQKDIGKNKVNPLKCDSLDCKNGMPVNDYEGNDNSISNNDIYSDMIFKNTVEHNEQKKKRISGKKILISGEGINLILNEMRLGVSIQRLAKIIEEYDVNDDIISNIRQKCRPGLNNDNIRIKIPVKHMNKIIINYSNVIYKGSVLSEEDFNKLEILIDKSIPHKVVYGKMSKELIFIKNDDNAEFIGTYIMRGSISKNHQLTIGFGKDAHPKAIKHLENLIIKIFGETPTKTKNNQFYLARVVISQYLKSQNLSNNNRRVPIWVKKNQSFIVACLRGMINFAGSIDVQKGKFINIRLARKDKSILEDFKFLCNSINIKTNDPYPIREQGNKYYCINIGTIDDVRRFLIDIVKPMKWHLVRGGIQHILKKNGTSIENSLEMSQEFKDLKRIVLKDQNRKNEFHYKPIRIKNIKNSVLRKRLINYIENISKNLFPYNEFLKKSNIRPHCLQLAGSNQKNGALKTSFIEDYLINNLINNGKIKEYSYNDLSSGFYYDLLNFVQQVFTIFHNKYSGITPWHKPILKTILDMHTNAMATELPVWKKLACNFCVGDMDLILVYKDTLIVADYKQNIIEMIKSLAQIVSYGVMLKKLIFKKFSDFNSFDLKCIVFSKKTIWEFDPDLLKADIINFIEYTNSLRPKSDLLRSLPFAKGLTRTDLLEDIKKVFD